MPGPRRAGEARSCRRSPSEPDRFLSSSKDMSALRVCRGRGDPERFSQRSHRGGPCMKTLRFAALAAVSLAAVHCASSAGRSGPAASAPNPMVNFSTMVSGFFRGSTPGNELTLDIKNAGLVATTDTFNLFLTASGRYQGTNVRNEGVLHVEP